MFFVVVNFEVCVRVYHAVYICVTCSEGQLASVVMSLNCEDITKHCVDFPG